MKIAVTVLMLLSGASAAGAQTATYSGFVEGRVVGFPQKTAIDSTRLVGDALFRNELLVKPSDWFRITAGLDLRANSHDQVEDKWRVDFEDRGRLRPRATIRRLAASVSTHGFTLDAGKQFIRWGRADVIYPTDRFAPRDYLNVIDSELLPVTGVRAAVQAGSETFEGIWVPRLTPTRLPLIDQRWAPLPSGATGTTLTDAGAVIPTGSQFGGRWRHTGSRLETAVSFFDGFNHLPNIDLRLTPDLTGFEVRRTYPEIRMIGGDVAIPTTYLTLKGETAYVTSSTNTSDDYVLYVIEIERQAGEWLLDVGYAGEVVREARGVLSFAPDRSMAKSIIGRAAYTVDPRRTVVIEGAVRQSGDGFYGKLEFSQAMKEHWRLTVTGVGLGGQADDFLGQYKRNSHGSVTLRYSF
jgi:hypothetical protein